MTVAPGHLIARAARYERRNERYICDETRVLIAMELVRLRRHGLLDAVYTDGGRLRVRHKPDSLLTPLSWAGAAKLIVKSREAEGARHE